MVKDFSDSGIRTSVLLKVKIIVCLLCKVAVVMGREAVTSHPDSNEKPDENKCYTYKGKHNPAGFAFIVNVTFDPKYPYDRMPSYTYLHLSFSCPFDPSHLWSSQRGVFHIISSVIFLHLNEIIKL